MAFGGFRGLRGGGVRIELDSEEATVLRSMAQLVLELVEAPEEQDELAAMVGIGSNSETPEDPVLARLLPDAYAKDGEEGATAAAEFRRYTEDGLRQSKRANAAAMLASIPESGGQVELDAETAQAWMKSLNDVRLILGTRLNVDEETLTQREQDRQSRQGRRGGGGEDAEATEAALNIYDWLSGMQDSLIRAIQD
ncbi:DUF2017 domain-containing protein [Lipingzhangella sp. LS1_29]|uniref:DUF2017 domain-containing protein n=1 Tax=Lipingzhangella rawalii TaxID=2055835 RepID=A0ABU2H5C7_9ACTN|nr:DUF2017 domain-containing protein [Lipingzhangella rawalii]MDS1270511.1 DUF2017 domain-containing protein [Lipingzhangella rawalii]